MDGACKSKPLACDDGDQCTADSCSPTGGKGGKGGCVFAADTKKCDDGNVCTKDVCAKLTGCGTVALKGTPCDDGSPCTEGDTCANKACVAGREKLHSSTALLGPIPAGYTPSSEELSQHGSAIAEDGDLLVAKPSRAPGSSTIARFDAAGKKRWAIVAGVTFGIANYEKSMLRAIAAGAKNTAVAAGWQGDLGASRAVVYRVDAAGKVLGAKMHGDKAAHHKEPRIARLAAGGHVVADLVDFNKGVEQAILWALDDAGE